jgi:hypothetical protein
MIYIYHRNHSLIKSHIIMKKLMLVAAVAAFVLIGFSSCKKCSTCSATKTGSTTIDGAETCGNSGVIDDYEAAFKTTYEAAGYTVTCE